MDTTPPPHQRATRSNPAKSLAKGIATLTSSISSWRKQRSLERVQHLNDHLLDDIGVEREPDCRTESLWRNKPPP
jgi:uncharacterized protein YjiS (DUF1127 family)